MAISMITSTVSSVVW